MQGYNSLSFTSFMPHSVFYFAMEWNKLKTHHFNTATKVARRPAHTIAVDCAGQGAENKVSFFSVQ